MKRPLSIVVMLFIFAAAYSQTLPKQDVIASAGGFNQATGISISWTLGETIVPTFTSTDNTIILTHGFQPQLLITAVEENIDVKVNVTVYPNPASDVVNIRFEEAVQDEMRVTIISSGGKPVKSLIIEPATLEKQINLQDLPAGIYYLRLTKEKLSNVYKVVKL